MENLITATSETKGNLKAEDVLRTENFDTIMEFMRFNYLSGDANHRKLISLTTEKQWKSDLVFRLFKQPGSCMPSQQTWEFLEATNPTLYQRIKC